MKINDYIEIINENLDNFLPIEYPQTIFKSMKYTVLLPGKRLRPVMCLETCAMLGGEIENAIPTACAIEMLHAQTLIHDDLPCMDNDDYRRGKLTNHKVFGEAIAVLAGDALLTFAPQIITKYSKALTPSTIIRVLNEFFHFAGARGVIAGQVVDIESENILQATNKDTKELEKILEYLHLHKTSDLFQLSMRTGAIIAGAGDEKIEAITDFAKTFGLAFQIADDILDEISTFEQMGKTLGKDKEEGKLTYVSLYGLEGAKCKLSCLFEKCYGIMKKQDIKSEIFNNIIEDILKRTGIKND
ncbi:polyprenyl synthetase family protein [bacterium]|nr:polyprenyl synthetase family protein [bacterium]